MLLTVTNFITRVSFKHTFQLAGIRLTTFMVIGPDLQPTFPNGIQNAYKDNNGNTAHQLLTLKYRISAK